MTFKKVKSNQSFPEMEEEILKFWEENKIFEKSLTSPRPSPCKGEGVKKKDYVFYDGPPFATGTPHYGHIVGSVMKDAVPRYWTMKGYRVERKWGWDCHGLPIENIVEKEMGSKTKKEIEELGVEKFNELCRSKVLQYVSEWEKVIKRLGRWADMKNAYKTMDLPFMESVWWVFKELYNKGLVYESYRSMHICPRCETTLSQSEVAEGYKDIKDLSCIAKFELEDEPTSPRPSPYQGEGAKIYILAWTTTPWTLIGNVALAVGEDIDYIKIRIKKDGQEIGLYIMEKSYSEKILPKILEKIGEKIEWVGEGFMKGKELVGKKYKPVFDYYFKQENLENREQGWKIYAADFVTTDEGTGVVHIAPAFGEDDMNLGKKYNLPFIQHVGMDGIIKKEAGDPMSEYGTGFAGVDLKPRAKNKPEEIREADLTVVKFLEKQVKIFHSEKYEHSYPHCWRCDTPLINYATSSWFVAVTKIKDRALELAKNINWTPAHIKEGRFGNWLEGARDWSISRQRFWASVIPIWRCEKCKEIKVIGSVEELEELSGQKITDLHKHIVDKITFKCSECDGTMKRIPDVLDCWFESGSMPYAQMHYPFENKEKFEANFPAEFIAEGQDQCRCWFYYLHTISTAIKDSHAFKNVIVNGIVVGEDGKKLSKKLKNYPDPSMMFEKYGADSLRFYLMSSPVVAAENLSFKESDVADVVRGMMRMLWNSYSFFTLYAGIDKFIPNTKYQIQNTKNLLDRWIISELNVLIKEVDGAMEKYELNKACRLFPKFIDNLSNWYIRRSRKRFWKSEDDDDKNSAYETLYYVLVELSKLMAPFTPFMAEEIYRNLVSTSPQSSPYQGEGANSSSSSPLQEEGVPTAIGTDEVNSVHLADFPAADEKLIDEKLNQEMESARNIITEALQLRAKAGIKVRQPLSDLRFKIYDLRKDFLEIIKEEVNVKKVLFDESILENVLLNTEITEELRLEGQAREIIRFIQEMRKEAGYEVDNRIKVCYIGQSAVFEKFGSLVAKETLAVEIKEEKPEKFDLQKTLQVDGKEIIIWIKNL